MKKLYSFLQKQDIGTSPIWQPLNTLPMFADCYSASIKEANDIYSRALMLPSSVGLSEEDQDKVCDTVNEFLEGKDV